jgi:hypothetical protein
MFRLGAFAFSAFLFSRHVWALAFWTWFLARSFWLLHFRHTSFPQRLGFWVSTLPFSRGFCASASSMLLVGAAFSFRAGSVSSLLQVLAGAVIVAGSV